MNFSRRNFLRLFSYASLAAIAPLEALCAIRKSVITSDPFHFSLAVPAPWQVLSPQSYLEALEKNILRDNQRHDISNVPLPIVTVTRHPEPLAEFNPGVIVQADRYKKWMGDEILLFHSHLHEEYLDSNCNSAVEKAPHAMQWAGIPAASSAISYDHLTTDGGSPRVTCRAYSLFHRDTVFFLTFGSLAGREEKALDPFRILAPHIRFY